jgi:MoxR-like ATPase
MTYCQDLYKQILAHVDGTYILGSRLLIRHCLAAHLARGHVLIEGPPGTGKTITAKLLVHLFSTSFKRIQMTSDMLPADITGAHIYSPSEQSFAFIKGPIFADIVLADEVNRTPPRTQSALLEAMEERQVTAEGVEMPLSPDFFVVATQNPRDFEGAFPLPEAQLDRFLFKLKVQHASREVEADILQRVLTGVLPPRTEDMPRLPLDRKRVDEEIQAVRVDDSIITYVTAIVQQTRQHPMIQWGSSIRAGIAFVKCSRILAAMEGRDFVIPDDIKEIAVPILGHRIYLTPEAQLSDMAEHTVIDEIMKQVAFPQ